VSPEARAELRDLFTGRAPAGPLGDPGMHRALLRAYLAAQLSGDRPLRSLDLLLQQGLTGPDPT
jgi:hypothetical protein